MATPAEVQKNALPTVQYQWLPDADYQATWDYQSQLHQDKVARKRANRELEKTGQTSFEIPEHHLLFVEHKAVYTLGKSGSMDHLLLNEQELDEGGFQFYKINRGGDITYHGPGQLVVYPILDLDDFFHDVHLYVRNLEEIIIRTIADFGLRGMRERGYTGVWLAAVKGKPLRKICAIGVHLSRWVSMHGLAFNVKTNLNHFGNIIPCGIQEDSRDVTSLSLELGREVELEEVIPRVQHHFAEVFGCKLDFSTTAPTI